VAVVTGAARGIGRAIARRLSTDGAVLAIGDADGDALAKTAAALGGPEAADTVQIVGDLSTRPGAAALIGEALAAHGRVDILVNNAGGGVILPTLCHTEETLRQTIDANLWTAIYCTLEVLPPMVAAQFGRIINIGAESVRNGLDRHAIYNAAKGGVHGMTSGLAREFIGHGITVNTVAPAMVETERVTAGRADPEIRAFLDQIVATIPARRTATVEEVASLVAYLASDDAAFVTGQIMSVNGGSSML
jgi:2,3-dihydroxy-2,3-dihydro-p-cumate dehydrogenase